MKKVFALAVSAILLLSGCERTNNIDVSSSETKAEEVSSTSAIRTKESTTSSALSVISTEDIIPDDSDVDFDCSSIAPKGSEQYNNLVDFIRFANDLGSDEFYSVSVGGIWIDDSFSIYKDFLNVESYKNQGIVCCFAMVYVDDVDIFRLEVRKYMEDIQETLDETYLNIDLFELYINNAQNEHIATISNDGGFGEKTNKIYWYTPECREKYGKIEEEEIFEGYEIKVLGE